ncbi:MAG: MFS transporter [Acidobacteria bacterium]|nr:MAG: MFS transporter [Acidobacteriota bacterium]
MRRTIPALRWWIGAALFASTIINYIDRQTLSLLAPFLKVEYRWSNTDYAYLVIAFRFAYSIGQTILGRLIDRIGTRRGLTITVAAYSLVSILTSLANGFYSFGFFRFLLGAAESANWPAATKAVSEWFPKHERGLATALFDSGSSVGGAIAPFIVLWIYFRWGWRPSFAVPGCLGVLWLVVWQWLYYPPALHPRISDAERQMIASDRADSGLVCNPRLRWRDLLALPQTWGVIVAKTFTDPVWFFVADAADLGNFFGGGVSGHLIKQGWSLGEARKAVVVFGGIGVTLLIPTIFTTNLFLITALFALSTFCYASFSTIANVLPSDLYPGEAVATVSGLSGTGAGLATIVAFYLIGHYSDRRQATTTHAFDPIVVVAGLVPLAGMILVLLLVRNTEATRRGLVRRI